MTNEEQHNGDVPAAGSEANASGPVPQEGDFTVEDILNAEQNADAADAASGASDQVPDQGENGGGDESSASDAENPYLEDLRRLSAEYANYRKRTEANAAVEKQRAVAAAVSPMLSVLDDLDRAEQHGDLPEGSAFATIAQKLRGTLEKLGLESYGEKGEAFDPQFHEAIAQVPVPGTEEHTVLDVIERGYRIGEVELRPAKVAVAVGADG
ncbi:nucleotide exchange factor GrpE [Leucobacter sp. HY1910]